MEDGLVGEIGGLLAEMGSDSRMKRVGVVGRGIMKKGEGMAIMDRNVRLENDDWYGWMEWKEDGGVWV
ncbi:hypothetical protein [Paenibacillus xylanexedens]|uniref:hypothetical protein n=1 Tax=Paenibacillus xylanexedens TaxID=528191 RepID=UPI001C92D98D|nr:hypothetical protein [Paenibacillus xylanexedens]